MAKAPRVRLKTRAELASPEFVRKQESQAEVLRLADAAAEKLPKARRDYILDLTDDRWWHRFGDRDDAKAVGRETRKWSALRTTFLQEVSSPLEIHWFTLNWDCDRGLAPLGRLIRNPHCDAGTALRLYWINDPYYYQGYGTLKDCPYKNERDMLAILRTIERRFLRAGFATRTIPFDPTPWTGGKFPGKVMHEIPLVMHEAIRPRGRRR